MARFLALRLGLTAVTLVLVSIAVFAVAEVVPGDVGRTVLGPFATPAQVARFDHEVGADRPLVRRYARWASRFARGEWGRSASLDEPVRGVVLRRLRASLVLAAYALALVLPLAIGCGVLAAVHEGRLLDRVISIAGLSLIAVPEFVTGAVVLVVLAVRLHWLPASSEPPTSDPVDVVRQLTLPAIPLMLVLFGYVSRVARAGVADALASEYAEAALLKGLPRRTVIWRHALRNAMIPTVSVVSVQVAYLVGGLVVVETLFDYPGIGSLLLDAGVGHDLPVLEASVLVLALLTMAANLAADLLYAALDPRIRLVPA
jgi:peptide/nickel transport system permease protein